MNKQIEYRDNKKRSGIINGFFFPVCKEMLTPHWFWICLEYIKDCYIGCAVYAWQVWCDVRAFLRFLMYGPLTHTLTAILIMKRIQKHVNTSKRKLVLSWTSSSDRSRVCGVCVSLRIWQLHTDNGHGLYARIRVHRPTIVKLHFEASGSGFGRRLTYVLHIDMPI